jgi:hypothetical protein
MNEEEKRVIDERKALYKQVREISEKYRKPLTEEQLKAERKKFEASLQVSYEKGIVWYIDPDPEITEILRKSFS